MTALRNYRLGFWGVAFAFTALMAFTTVPTPLWSRAWPLPTTAKAS